MLLKRAPNFNVSYEAIDLKKIFGEIEVIENIGCAFVSNENSKAQVAKNFISISPLHGRACATSYNGNFFSLKGTGWSFAGPRYFLSPTLEELFYGLLPEAYAEKELIISNELHKKGFLAGRVIGYGLLGDPFSKLKVGNTLFNPAVLYTQMISPYRIADLMYFNLDQRRDLFQTIYSNANNELKNASLKTMCWDFIKKLFIANNNLINLGGINDSLMWDNVTLACEIVDFEMIFIPGINVNDRIDHIRLPNRQKQSYIWLFELLYKMVNVLELDISFQEIALQSFLCCENDLKKENKKFLESFIYSKT
jgi:hypothetical protein